jgi:spore germination protein YaaH
MEARLTHALKAIPKEKLSLGIPLYCNKWSATGRTSSTWEKLGKEKNVSVACSDGATAALETAVATRHGVSSFALWRLGGEDPAVWNLF